LCSYNQLTSLEGAPKVVNGNFYCDSNKLTSLKGSPKIIKRFFNCKHNKLQSLDYLPDGIFPEALISDFSKKYVFEFFSSNRPEMLI
jgi:hypothetical protein